MLYLRNNFGDIIDGNGFITFVKMGDKVIECGIINCAIGRLCIFGTPDPVFEQFHIDEILCENTLAFERNGSKIYISCKENKISEAINDIYLNGSFECFSINGKPDAVVKNDLKELYGFSQWQYDALEKWFPEAFHLEILKHITTEE